MLAQEIDFHEIFKVEPTAMALLTADLVFVDANDEFLRVVRRPLDDLVGHNFFEKFPKVPECENGSPKWTALEAAMTTGRRQVNKLSRYDIEDPDRPGVFEERYWSAVVTPIRGIDGKVELLEVSARELTQFVTQLRELGVEQEQPA
jgi:PAS domain-containing protein